LEREPYPSAKNAAFNAALLRGMTIKALIGLAKPAFYLPSSM
jgi:hypothetical protein